MVRVMAPAARLRRHGNGRNARTFGPAADIRSGATGVPPRGGRPDRATFPQFWMSHDPIADYLDISRDRSWTGAIISVDDLSGIDVFSMTMRTPMAQVGKIIPKNDEKLGDKRGIVRTVSKLQVSIMLKIVSAALLGGPLTSALLWEHGPAVAVLCAPIGGSFAGLLAGLAIAAFHTAGEEERAKPGSRAAASSGSVSIAA